MQTIKELNEEIAKLLVNIEDEAEEEVHLQYEIFDKNTKLLLESKDIESYMVQYKQICESENGVLECFDIDNPQELQTYLDEKEINLDDLKLETLNASCEALKFLIYEAEEEEY